MLRRRRRLRGEKPKASIDMNSLIDLTFLLLVTFIVTLPALEQGISIMLPQAKTDELPTKNKKANTVTVDKDNVIFLNDKPLTLEELERELMAMAAEDPEVLQVQDTPHGSRDCREVGRDGSLDRREKT